MVFNLEFLNVQIIQNFYLIFFYFYLHIFYQAFLKSVCQVIKKIQYGVKTTHFPLIILQLWTKFFFFCHLLQVYNLLLLSFKNLNLPICLTQRKLYFFKNNFAWFLLCQFCCVLFFNSLVSSKIPYPSSKYTKNSLF